MLDRVVADAEAGQRADVVLAGWLREPRARSAARFDAGEVTVADTPAVKSRRLRAGERVRVAEAAVIEAAPPPVVAVRYADEHLAVVAKPAGLVVHPGAGARGPTLVDALRAQGVALAAGADPARPGIVHRLDRGTSGLLVVASSEEARAGLAQAFAVHAIERRYWALVDGVPQPRSATIDAPIARHPRHRTRFTVDASGRGAVTHYDVERVSAVTLTDGATAPVAVLDVRLETGRTHQVRVHLASIHHPVAGDRAYGASARITAALGLRRPALHAGALGFRHPVTGERLAFDEPLPADLAEVAATLRAS